MSRTARRRIHLRQDAPTQRQKFLRYYHEKISSTTIPASQQRLCSSSSLSSSSKPIDTKQQQQELARLKQTAQESFDLYHKNLASLSTSSSQESQLQSMIADLEREQADPDFWSESNADRAQTVTAQLSQYSRLLSRIRKWKQWYEDCVAALEMLTDHDDTATTASGALSQDERDMLVEELEVTCSNLLQDNRRFELELLLSGPYDSANARMVLTAGAGGTEATDWVADLKRMYERHAEQMGYTVTVEDYQEGDVVGYKSVEMLISGGENAYGWFQGEKGAHRLVRLSPFNASNKRQTTFAGIDVAPDILNEDTLQDIDIPDNELEITTMRSGGKGGQNVNKVNSAVRIKHIPSGLQVKCTQERSQPQNKEIALKRLKAQLLAIAQEQRVQDYKQIRGDIVEASWGAQIRNYVLHPYKMIKDQRTGWETSNAQGFLDGDLEECIGAYLRWKSAQAASENQK